VRDDDRVGPGAVGVLERAGIGAEQQEVQRADDA
jgi:hypothetical protein